MSFYNFGDYVTVEEKRRNADIKIAKLQAEDPSVQPIILSGKVIATTWWGKAWNKNLESYADYSNRIGRGRSYVRNHAVLDLRIAAGYIYALVLGSSKTPYEVRVEIDALSHEHWKQVTELCNHKIDSIEQLTGGMFPKELEELFTEAKYALFPNPKEIHFTCSCPDNAYMCKHIAAVLYGVSVRLDSEPLLFFLLRRIDYQELIKRSIESKLTAMLQNAERKSKRAIAEKDVHDIFGI